ncbi:MAG: nucleoside hydrolase [bacterium]
MTGRRKVIIDTDPAFGYFGRDMDDGLAIMFALNSQEIEPLALTVTHGNVSMPKAFRSAKNVLKFLEREEIPVYRGAAAPGADDTEAADKIPELISAHGGGLTILAIGPLSNLAAAEKRCPGVLSRVHSLVIMGGAVYRKGNVPPFMHAEFNFWKDPLAAGAVLQSGARIVLFPLDVTHKVTFGGTCMKRLRASSSPAARFLLDNLKVWHWMNSTFTLLDGFHPHDPIAASYLVAPELFELTDEKLEIHRTGSRKGMVFTSDDGVPVSVAVDVDENAFLNLLLERLLSPPL